jgi:hypothetical protein
MLLDKSLAAVASFARPEKFEDFRRHIDPQWIEEALAATGTASLRRRRLPAEQVIWLVLGMGLFRNRPITDVVAKLDLALPKAGSTTVVPSAIPQARERLGEEPMDWLFLKCAKKWAHESADRHRWRGLALYAVDGSKLRVPDSLENRTHFGGHHNATAGSPQRNESGYPLIRVVALMALRSHLIVDARLGPYRHSETSYAKQLIVSIPENSLTILDRLFVDASILIPLARGGNNRHWLLRAKANTKWRVLKNLGPGDELVEMSVSNQARKIDPMLPKYWVARAIQYRSQKGARRWLLTSLTDGQRYPAAEFVQLYRERWEIEQGYDEVKTELLEAEETIRSKSPASIRQELWGVLLAYNLVRLEMERIAEEARVEPTRISFVNALRLIQDEWLWAAVTSPGAIPKRLRELREAVKLFILPPRRTHRIYPRAIKLKTNKYVRKLPQLLATN